MAVKCCKVLKIDNMMLNKICDVGNGASALEYISFIM